MAAVAELNRAAAIAEAG
jgi:RNA polymerase sigma-70 factor, ECF subfamily